MVILLSSIIDALNSKGRFRTLGNLSLRRDKHGIVECYIGSNVVVVPLVGDESMALRLYITDKPYLHEIYGDCYYPEEFFIDQRYIDVVLTHWVEGETLAEVVAAAAQRSDGEEIVAKLSQQFDRLASDMIDQDWAHGDLCCENIIVTPDGELRLIDNDSNYLPTLAGCSSEELGHAAYQSPRRETTHFHPRIDDFSIALISVTLAALSLDLNLYRHRQSSETLLFDSSMVGSEGIAEVLKRGCRVAHLAMLRELNYQPVVIDQLPQLLRFINRGVADSEQLTTFEKQGLWGYRDHIAGAVAIPPIFDMACEFCGDKAIVAIERMWYQLNINGTVTEYKV